MVPLSDGGRKVSIHAPTWGATSKSGYSCVLAVFQSTLPHGERLYYHMRISPVFVVSIHAPTWGATLLLQLCRKGKGVSIHAPTWGATDIPIIYVSNGEFQSTLPHGERQLAFTHLLIFDRFQSTLPHGERLAPSVASSSLCAFQSTLPHGERRLDSASHVPNPGFNPRSHMGSDVKLCACSMSYQSFNPRSHMGSDPCFSAQRS